MRAARFEWDGSEPEALAAEIRALQPSLDSVSDSVAEIVAGVRGGGDAAVLEVAQRFGETPANGLRVPAQQIREAAARVSGELAGALETAQRNVRAVADAEAVTDLRVTPPEGHSVGLRTVAVGAAGVYVPGGAAEYPSSLIMGCTPAKAAGVERVVVVTPPGEGGEVGDAVLAAAQACGVDEVFAVGGPHAIAALAFGTESIPAVDVIVGPGNRYVQEAKRMLAGRVGIDGVAGPSELMVVLDGGAELDWLALDLCSQAEHGDDGLLVAAAADDALLDDLARRALELAEQREHVGEAPLALVSVPSPAAAVTLADAIAPEHLELACAEADGLSGRARTAGCVLIGNEGATAFGDYAAGSNHVLPTGGSGRFTGPLGPAVFRRRIATVRITQDAARELAPSVATLARTEGFPLHAESVEARIEDRSEGDQP